MRIYAIGLALLLALVLLAAPTLNTGTVGMIGVTATAQAQTSPRDALIARAKSLELNTPYVPPPGDPLEHEAQEVVADLIVDRGVEIRHGHLPGLQLATELFVLTLEQRFAAQQVDRAMLRGRHEPRVRRVSSRSRSLNSSGSDGNSHPTSRRTCSAHKKGRQVAGGLT